MWHDHQVEKCFNHKDRVARYYEDQSGLHFCIDCHYGLRNASERDLYLMTHSEKLEVKAKPAEEVKDSEPAKESIKDLVNDWTTKKKH